MITSGNNSRSISSQSGGILDFTVRFSDAPSNFKIGVSGTSFFGIDCNSGFISINNSTFSSIGNESKRIRINYSLSQYDLHVDGVQVVCGAEKPTGIYENLIFNSTTSIDHSLFVSGEEPSLELEILNNSDSGNNIVSGLLRNLTPHRRFRIFNATVDSSASSKFAVTGWQTGTCQTGCLVRLASLENIPTSASGVKLNFDSNFGSFSINANIPSSFSGTTQIFTVSPDQDTFFASAGSKFFNIMSFFQGDNRNLQVKLEYVSGGLSDQLRSLETGSVTGWVSGFIQGCGTATSQIIEYKQNITGLSGYVFSGNMTGTSSSTYCHTGNLLWSGLVNMSGRVPSGASSGQLYTLNSGVSLSGTVLTGSGSFLFNRVFSGFALSGSTHIPVTGYVNRTEYLYATAGRVAGTGVSGVNVRIVDSACGTYSGTSMITQTKPYYYNFSGWSGIINSTFSGMIIPTGIYSKAISGIGTGVQNSVLFSGLVTGLVTGLVNNSFGYSVFNGTISGFANYTGMGCVKSGDRLVGNIQPAKTPLYDGYFNRTGTLYTFGFSPTREYLLGSGFPCNAYLSGYIYEGSPTGGAIFANQVSITLRRRSNNAFIATKLLSEFVRSESIEIASGDIRNYGVYRVPVPELTGVNLTDDLYITGSYLYSGEFGGDAFWENYFNLTLVPFMSGAVSGSGVVSYPYSHTGYLTGVGCASATGTVSGTVSGMWTLLNATGIASGVLLGPLIPVDFTDMWNLRTGIGQYVYDFKNSGWFTAGQSGNFSRSSAAMITRQNIFNEPFVEVLYSRALNSGTSVAKLSVFDGYNIEEIFISGF